MTAATTRERRGILGSNPRSSLYDSILCFGGYNRSFETEPEGG